MVRHLEVGTVLRVSLLFYFMVIVVFLVAGVLVWNVASASGTINRIDKSIKALFDLKTFSLHCRC